MPDTLAPSDILYFSIKNQKGWIGPLGDAQAGPSPLRSHVGSILSSILLATDEGDTAVAVGGEIDENGKGYIAVITDTGVVYVETAMITSEDTRYTVSLHSFDDVSGLSVTARHSYFDGTESRPRHKGMSFKVTIDEKAAIFKPALSDQTSLTDSDAMLRAFRAIRAGQ